MKKLRFVVLLLLVIGGLNWGLYGFFQYDLVADLFGNFSAFSRIIYGIVGIAGLLGIVGLFCSCRSCDSSNGNSSCCSSKNKKK